MEQRIAEEALQRALLRIAERSAALKTEAEPFVRPICMADARGAPEVVGSCVLVALGKHRVLLTAAHVLDWADKGTLYLVADGDIIALPPEFHRTVLKDGKTRADDVQDMGIVELPAEFVDRMGGCQFLGLEDLAVELPTKEGQLFAMVGYPRTKAKANPTTKKFKPGLLAPITMEAIEGFDKERYPANVHRVVKYDPAKMRSGSNPAKMPDLYGISGGALFEFESLKSKTHRRSKVAGIIVLGNASSEIVVATKSELYVEALKKIFPDEFT